MKHPILTTFALLFGGLILFFLIIFLYILTAKPFGIDLQNVPSAILNTQDQPASSASDNPLLSLEQNATLKSYGIDPSTLPTKITPEQLSCAEEKLGSTRFQELKEGSAPTLSDYFKAKDCLQ